MSRPAYIIMPDSGCCCGYGLPVAIRSTREDVLALLEEARADERHPLWRRADSFLVAVAVDDDGGEEIGRARR